MSFKAIELDPLTRRRSGREMRLQAESRQAAVNELLELLQVDVTQARIDPTRSLVQLASALWTIVGATPAPPSTDTPSLRRAGAKHRRVR